MVALTHIVDARRASVSRGTTRRDGDFWASVAGLVDRIDDMTDLRAHRLHLLAGDRWRQLGRPLPDDVAEEERVAAVLTLVAPVVLRLARDAYDGTIVLMKGPEIAARYPDPALRPFRDLDLLVDDAPAAQRALLAAGFVETGAPELYVDIHHLRPLLWPGLPIVVEIHERPKWPEWLVAPTTSELLAAAIPGTSGVEGVLALPPEHHALVLAAHSWAHEPLRRLVELVDIAALAREGDSDATVRLAHAWGLQRVWSVTCRATESVLQGGRKPLALRTWARNLASRRERTVLESHLEHWLAPFWILPWPSATRVAASAVLNDIRPTSDETWRAKASRSVLALRNAFRRRSEHDRVLAERAGTADKGRSA